MYYYLDAVDDKAKNNKVRDFLIFALSSILYFYRFQKKQNIYPFFSI